MTAPVFRIVEQLPRQVGQLLIGDVLVDPSHDHAALDERLPHFVLLLGIVTSRGILWNVEPTLISPLSLIRIAPMDGLPAQEILREIPG
jgi:hypothetical protein